MNHGELRRVNESQGVPCKWSQGESRRVRKSQDESRIEWRE